MEQVCVGVDVGATLAKLAMNDATSTNGVERPPASLELLPSTDPAALANRLVGLSPEKVALTGAGAAELAALLPFDVARVNEFAAWGAGAGRILSEAGGGDPGRYLLVSLGTGTSVLLVDGMAVTRVGGTALGGGTLMGLGSALAGVSDFAAFCELAAKGSRGAVDLLVSDIYRAGEIPLMGELTAASFAKLGRFQNGSKARPEDMAAGLVGLVGENVALICGGLAAASQVRRVVFAGSTLRENPALVEILTGITRLMGREPMLLENGEFAGALGCLSLSG